MAAVDWDKRMAFAREYAISNNGTQAAIKAGVPASSAHAVAYKWLRNSEIIALIKDELDARLRDLAPLAINVLKDLMGDSTVAPQTRLTAARDVMDRLGWIPPKRSDASIAIHHKSLDELSVDELMALAFDFKYKQEKNTLNTINNE